jgi:hypothetical protein
MTEPQHLTALAEANVRRLAGAEVRRELADHRLSIEDAVRDERAGALTVDKLLRSVPGVGRAAVPSILARARIVTAGNMADPTRRVRMLTDRQRDALVLAVSESPTLRKAA